MHLLSRQQVKFAIVGLAIGVVVGILIPMFIGGDGSYISVGDRLILTGNPQNTGVNIPISTAGASAAGWVDPMLCAPGRGRYFTKNDSANLVVLYNNAENVVGFYLRSDGEMPDPWKKTDALKGGGGIEVINQEHWGLYAFFNDSLRACERPDSSTSHTQNFLGPHAVRTEYEPTPTPAAILDASEIVGKILASLSGDSRAFDIINPVDQSNIIRGITSSQINELISSLTNAEKGASKWINNISHSGLTGDIETSSITKILASAKSDNLKISLWVNDDNQVNLIEITGTINYEGKEFSKLHISPE
tara:strand:- start:482 stop:1396 length:915 start_codon:yes stop_codon:yes gene_type:complete